MSYRHFLKRSIWHFRSFAKTCDVQHSPKLSVFSSNYIQTRSLASKMMADSLNISEIHGDDNSQKLKALKMEYEVWMTMGWYNIRRLFLHAVDFKCPKLMVPTY